MSNQPNVLMAAVGVAADGVPILRPVKGVVNPDGTAKIAVAGGGDFKSDGTVAGTGNFTTTGSMRADGGFSVNDDTLLQRVSAANWRLGAADASAPVAQTLSVQNVIAGTSNTAGADRTYLGSASTGNAVGGGHVFKTTPAGSSGSAQNSQATAMTIAGSGDVGIGQTTPTAGLHIDTAARSATGLKIRTALGQDLFNYLKPGGTSLLRAVWDGSNFHHYLNSANINVNLNGSGYVFDGNGLSSYVFITNGTKLYLNSTDTNTGIIRCGTSGYATAGNPLTAIVPMEFITWAWNGVDGYSVTSSSTLVQTQLSATNGDARLAIKNSANTDVFGIALLSGNVGIANTSPGEKLDVTGNIKSSGFQRTTPVTVATLIAAATAGAGARHFVTDSTVAASGNFGAAVTGGGSDIVPVYSDGTSWRIG